MVDWLEQLVWMAGELVLARMVALGSLQPIDSSAACGLPAWQNSSAFFLSFE